MTKAKGSTPNETTQVVPDDLLALMQERDGAAKLLQALPKRYSHGDVAGSTLRPGPGSAHNAWETCGYTYLTHGRVHEAIAVFQGLYDYLLEYQERENKRAHKGSPLVFLSDCYSSLNRSVIAKHYLMLGLCEDAIQNKGVVRPEKTGIYFRAVWHHGLSDQQVKDYTRLSWECYRKDQKAGRYPEWLLQEVDHSKSEGVQEWMTECPTPSETTVYALNRHYVSWLLQKLGKSRGLKLERLAHYLLSAIPGCRARMRMRTPSTDYDVVGFLDGHFVDFRADLGRYFICECKDWSRKTDFTAIAKFARVLESAKARSGIIFSKEGISGEGKGTDAERELLKLFQDRGIAVLVVSLTDLQEVAKGRNFIEILRSKYDAVRLDLQPPPSRKKAAKKK
jgi:hypothetical protein